MPSLLDDLQSYQTKRRYPNWHPRKPETTYRGDKDTADYRVLARCLHFLPLELQVKQWDMEALNIDEVTLNEVTEDGVEDILRRNAADEDKHNTVLTYLSEYMGVPWDWNADDFVMPQAAADIMERWASLNSHPLVAMFALEIGVFFSILPTLSTRGDVYCASVANWIADDEAVHVNTGLRLMKALGLKIGQKELELIRDTNLYIFEPLSQKEATSRALRACNRALKGVDPAMLNESLPPTIANFEQISKESIVY